MNFSNKIVWITGASSGIGEACVYTFGKQGAKIIASSNEKDKLENVVQNSKNQGINCIAIEFDLFKADTINNIVDNTIKVHGVPDIVLNIAGISQRSFIIDTSVENHRKIFEINYFGTVIFTKALLPYMIKNGGGQICATSSIVGKMGFPLRSAYSASKHALHGFFETLKAENYKNNIHTTILIGGRIKTNISFNAITRTGKAHGKLDAGQANGISSQKAAEQILKAIKRKKHEAFIGGKELLVVFIKRLFPKWAYKIARKIKST